MSLFSGDAFPGTLTMNTRRLFFQPLVLEEQVESSYSWELPIVEIDLVTYDGDMGRLVFSADGLDQEIMGTDVSHFYERLQDLLKARDAGELEGADDEEQRVLLRGIVDVYLNELMATRGEVVVTRNRLQFQPARRLETMFWGDKQLDIRVDQIEHCSIGGVRQRLEVKAQGESFYFRGNLVPRLCGILNAVRSKEETPIDDEVIANFPASYFQGPMSQPGDFVLSSERLQFAPSGRLEGMFGVQKHLEIPLAQVTRVDVQGLLERRLVVHVGDEHHVFSVTEPLERLAEITELLRHLESHDEPLVRSPGLEERTIVVNRLLDRWKSSVSGLARADLLLLGPVVHLPRKPGARRGWLVLTSENAVFLPVGGPSGGEIPLSLPLGRLSSETGKMAPDGELHLSTGGAVLRFLPQGGQVFIDNFWRIWKTEFDYTEERQSTAEIELDDVGGFVNRRETYRARIPGGTAVQLHIPSEEAPGFTRTLNGRMRNVSLGGCAIALEDCDLEGVGPFIVEVDYAGAKMRISGVVVYTIERSGAARIIYGVAFQEMDFNDAQIIREIVMQLQREDLARRAENRD